PTAAAVRRSRPKHAERQVARPEGVAAGIAEKLHPAGRAPPAGSAAGAAVLGAARSGRAATTTAAAPQAATLTADVNESRGREYGCRECGMEGIRLPLFRIHASGFRVTAPAGLSHK